MPATVDAIVLLGWMERDFAVPYIMNECVFDDPVNEQQAEDLWRTYHDRVQALPERDATAPERLPLTAEEQTQAATFLEFHRRMVPGGGSVRDVIKINPLRLVAHQFYVVLDRAQPYMEHATARTWCARNTLATERLPLQLTINAGMNAVNVSLPHGEFGFTYSNHPQANRFEVFETARHVSVTEFQGRMILWAGYHRSYARMERANPDGMDRSSLLVALTTDADFVVSPQSPNQGLRAMVCGARPPLFGDFFDDRFFMRVRLRKKRYELQIRAQVVPTNEP